MLFEPGRCIPSQFRDRAPTLVPAPEKEQILLGTPYGLLLNECVKAPQLVPRLALDLLEQALTLRTHTYHCKTTDIIEYVVRLAVHVESAVSFALELARGEHCSLKLEQLPGIELTSVARKQLEAQFAKSQRMLRMNVRPMLLGWLEELKVEELDARTYAPNKVDGFCLQMAAVHAQLVLTLRNLPPRELELSDVRQLLLSFMYLQRRYKWNQPPPKPPHAPLPVRPPAPPELPLAQDTLHTR